MSMTPIEKKAQLLLIGVWNNVRDQFNSLNLPEPRPVDGHRIFSLIEWPKVEGQIAFTINPVTFNVPERANAHPNMYIVAQGRMYLDQAAILDSKKLVTLSFATEVGYFRMSKDKLNHVYGAHYDFSLNEIGHPIFHAQMKSYNDRGNWISQAFELDCKPIDYMAHVLGTVRLPTAQMDFFALVLQICADHLINKDSSPEQREAFKRLCEVSQSIQGAGHLWRQLIDAPPCMRAQHWYC